MKIKVIDYYEISQLLPENISIPKYFLEEYINGGRQDVLHNPDIFCENVRSVDLKEKDFSLFEKVNDIDKDTIIVVSLYLELFEFQQKQNGIHYIIDFYCNKFPNNKVVFFWNHDVNFAVYNHITNRYNNAVIINYNTSIKSYNDIVVPFWTMTNIDQLIETKTIFASLVCNITHPIRYILYNTLKEKNDYKLYHKLPYEEYRSTLAKSIYGLCPRGAGLSSYRFFECIHTNTIPVLFADHVVLPYEEELDYSKISVRIPEKYCYDFESINNILKSTDVWGMLYNINKQRHRFTLKGIQSYIHERLK